LNLRTDVHYLVKSVSKVPKIGLKKRKSLAAAAHDVQPAIRVLIVDDEPLFMQMLQSLLDVEAGVEVVGEAANGKQGVNLAQELEPDVIVMDVSMPVMDGLEATREIRERDPQARVLILTGGTNVTDIDKARTSGASGYLTKDRIAAELVAEIRNLGAK
jgi:two-component system, NarL family, nitrate/nitrite response regulator NarL